jgi:YD repeat-containing protein
VTIPIARVVCPDRRRSHRRRIISRDVFGKPITNTRSTRSYDARNRMTETNAPNIYGQELIEYDVLDNVRRLAGAPDGSGGFLQDYRYQYNTLQRLTGIDNETGVQQWGFSHNGFGETLTRAGHSRNWSYQWNAAGRMIRAEREQPANWRAEHWPPFRSAAPDIFGDGFESTGTTAPDVSWEMYRYDAHGRRTLTTRNTGTTRYQVYSRAGQLLYVEDSRDNQRIDYIHLGNKLVAQRSRPLGTGTATVTWHHTDHIGSANVETNGAGMQTHRIIRSPYGAPYAAYREGPGYAGHVPTPSDLHAAALLRPGGAAVPESGSGGCQRNRSGVIRMTRSRTALRHDLESCCVAATIAGCP